jgi:hypothetical protein
MTPQDLSDTIGAIYDCALEPEHWPQTLARLEVLSRAGFSFIPTGPASFFRAGQLS